VRDEQNRRAAPGNANEGLIVVNLIRYTGITD
jgi:hypothetical protein